MGPEFFGKNAPPSPTIGKTQPSKIRFFMNAILPVSTSGVVVEILKNL
jgi:hypothetical protein